MKRYYNSDTNEWYTEGNSITKNISNGVFSGIPNVETYKAANRQSQYANRIEFKQCLDNNLKYLILCQQIQQ